MNKNFVTFIAVSMVILIGWSFVQRQFFPPKPADKKGDVAQVKDPEKKADDPKKDDKQPDAKKPDAKVAEVKNDDKQKDPKKEEPIPAPKDVATYVLGDDKSYLKLVVTNRGAGVQKLTLTKFKAADYLGRPVDRDLEFIQDDPIVPSFRMGVYGDAADGTRFQPELGSVLWNLIGDGAEKDGVGWEIAFWTLIPGQRDLKVIKTYRLSPVDYHVGLSLKIEHLASGTGKAVLRYQLTGAHGLPVEGEWYTPATSIRTSVIGKLDGRDQLWRKQEDAARIVAAKDAAGKPGKQGTKELGDEATRIQYAGVMTQYFASVILPDPKQPLGDWRKTANILGSASPTVESDEIKATILFVSEAMDVIDFRDETGAKITAKLLPRAIEHLHVLKLKVGSKCVVNLARDPVTNEAIAQWFRLGQNPLTYFDDLTIRVASDLITLPVGEKVTHNFMLYHGPVKTRLLGQMPADAKVSAELVDKYTNQLHLNTLTDYHSDTWLAQYVFSPIGWTRLLIWTTSLMHWLLYWLQFVSFGNWGLSIILLTIVVRGAMFPISRKQALMSQKMQALAPEVKKLQEKYKDDKAAQGQATMELYRKHKVSPAGGCLPLFLQMPIFMGLYYCLQESVQFRLAEFLWIDNLAAPDMLVWWGQGIPWLSDPDSLGGMLYLGPYFNLLPVIAVAFMVIQQKLMAPPAQNDEQEVQQRTMQIMMAVMGIFFYKVAAGLCLYFIASSIWGVLERKMLPKKTIAAIESASPIAKAIPNARERRREREREKVEPETRITKLKSWWQKLLESAEKK